MASSAWPGLTATGGVGRAGVGSAGVGRAGAGSVGVGRAGTAVLIGGCALGGSCASGGGAALGGAAATTALGCGWRLAVDVASAVGAEADADAGCRATATPVGWLAGTSATGMGDLAICRAHKPTAPAAAAASDSATTQRIVCRLLRSLGKAITDGGGNSADASPGLVASRLKFSAVAEGSITGVAAATEGTITGVAAAEGGRITGVGAALTGDAAI